MDCAVKFERNVAALPGVTGATLNIASGKLAVQGAADLEAIRREGRKENYTITPDGEGPAERARPGLNREMVRMVISGMAFLAAYLAERTGGPPAIFIPLYVMAVVTGGWGNARKAFYSLPRLDLNMSVLMTIAVIGAMAIGRWTEGAAVSFLYALSELLESWTMERTRRSLRELMDIAPRTARVRRPDGEEVELPVEEIRVGDVMIVRPGEKMAMDGRIIKGQSAVNQAAITGESVPVEKGPGDEVYAGTLNTHGSLEVVVTRLVQDTTIARIINLVEEAQAKRAPAQAFVDRFASIYTPLVIALAVGIVLAPPLFLGHPWGPWIYRGLALLVVACPCALVVSTPVTIVSAISNAARHGVLIKGGVYLEQAAGLQAVAFDKTGTLTRGEPAVTEIIPLDGRCGQELLRIAAGLEARSEHPLAAAVVREAQARWVPAAAVEGFQALPGRGAKGVLDGREVYIGNLRLFAELGMATDPVAFTVHRLQEEGKTAVVVGTAQHLLGVIGVADEVREDSAGAIAALRRAGIGHVIMLTGDNRATTRAVAARVGVDEFRAELLPRDKVGAVQDLLQRYGQMAMVGDGINDAPALATATVGIAMGGAGTDTALETADIVLMGDDLSKLPFTIALSRAALRVIRQNIAFALAVKLLAVLAVFPGWLTLWLAIMADMGASLLVTLNGMRLLRLPVRE
ncbi:cadmium-translocating P-type ATPase [Desulfofundulus thermobenzoicus]|uniref:Cd(2+)-exporting ATPase n=2 Tax=Desulfofundulus thermobenzoicus TaxID=29376 RepID=A0A6N7IRX7_9FIRM|nr:cadmium-translocating P-type ATPase [Desulfofundulus thermobenzoicus]